MKRLSLQWRLTLMTAVLIAATCIFLNLALSRAGMFYMDKLGQAIFHQTLAAQFQKNSFKLCHFILIYNLQLTVYRA